MPDPLSIALRSLKDVSSLVEAVRDLDARNEDLLQRVAELEEQLELGGADTEQLRGAYRAGYLAGRASKIRGAEPDPAPEQRARGKLGQRLRSVA